MDEVSEQLVILVCAIVSLVNLQIFFVLKIQGKITEVKKKLKNIKIKIKSQKT